MKNTCLLNFNCLDHFRTTNYKQKIKYLVILFLSIILLLPMAVFAKEGITLTVDKKDLEVGDEITVRVNIPSDLDTYAMMATLKYDENVFEKIDDSAFSVKETESVVYNADTSKFGIINTSGKITGELFQIRLKVKEDANVGDTNIALTNISSSNGNDKIDFSTVSTKVSVTRDAKEGETLPTNKENKIVEDEVSIIKTVTNTPIIVALVIMFIIILGAIVLVKTNNKIKWKMKLLYCLIALEMLLLIIISNLFIKNYNKKDVNNDGKNDYQDAEEIIKYLIDIKGTREEIQSSNASSGNSNTTSEQINTTTTKRKNVKNKSDEVENVTPADEKVENMTPVDEKVDHDTNNDTDNGKFDVNNDGQIDIEDVGHSVEDTTKKTEVTLKEISDKETYIQRGKITFKFTADITPIGVQITKVKINDTYYDVEYNNGIYYVTIDNEEIEAGKYNFIIEEVILNNDEKRQTNLKFTREVLKNVPYVNKFNLNYEKKSLSFDLVDSDEAFIEGTVIIYDGNKEIKIGNVETKGTTKIKNIELEEDKTYILDIKGRYDLDSNKNDGKNNYDNQNMFTQTFMIGGDYNFTLTNESITDAIQTGETPVLSFTSTNTRNATILTSNLTLGDNSKDYHITKIDGNNYEVALEGADTSPGKHTVTLNNVSLDSLKTFYNNKDYKTKTLTYTVLKDAPKVENLELSDDHDDKNIKAIFSFEDKYETTNRLTVVLVDSTGKIVSEKEINKEELKEGNIEVSLSYKRNTSASTAEGLYTVRVLADYELSDKYKYTNKSLEEKDILTTTNDEIYISEMYIEGGNLYPTKNQKNYKIAFTIHVGDSIKAIAPAKYGESRKYNKVQTITINGLNYTFNQNKSSTSSDYKGTVTITVPSDAGVLDIKANKVQLGISGYYNMTRTDLYAVEEKKVTIDVLKDQPKIENLTITDDYKKEEATFDFDLVLDPTEKKENFTDGKITLGSQSHDIEVGHNHITLNNIEKDKNLDLIFMGSYDLDTDTLGENPDKNVTKNGKIFSTKYGLYSNDTYENISIENARVISKKDNNYFEKNEKIKLGFDIENIDKKLDATLEKVIIDDKEYVLNKIADGYELILDGYNISGEKELVLTDVILSNGRKVTLTKPYIFTPEVLKDAVTINDFTYEVLDDTIQVDFDLKDLDNSLVGKAKVIITDENDSIVYEGDYKDKIKFNKPKDVLNYYVKVVTDYDRDIDTTKGSANYEEGAILLDEIISLERNNIELKDIIDINLYKEELIDGENKIVLKDTVNVDDIEKNKNRYFVEITMENLPTTRARIKNIVIDDKKLTLVLDYKYVTKEDNESQMIRIDYGSIEGNEVVNEFHPKNAFKVLLKELEEGKSVSLNRNYDASSIESTDSVAYVTSDYTGTLDGNGYTIKNLSKPLFNNIKGGEVKNLNITDVTLDDNGKGALANQINNSKITGVLVDKVKTKSEASGGRGGFIGTANNSEIKYCRATNITLSLNYVQQQNGTFIGVTNNSNIDNCYATGTINSGWNYTSGFVGDSKSSTMTNNYVKVTFNGITENKGVGFANSFSNSKSVYKNNVAFVTGSTTSFSGSAKEVKNNYIFTSSDISNVDGVNKITEKEINNELFKTKAQFDDKVWKINNVSIDDLPIFIDENKTELESIDGYDSNKEILYKNLIKLMPFYNDEKIVKSGSSINDSLLTTQILTHIIPVDANGNLVTYLTTDNPKKISRIKVVFKNGDKREYSVSYDKTYDMVAAYKIKELGVDYNYNHYVIDSSSQIVSNLTNYLKGLDYTNNLDTLTTNDDSRIYRDFYNSTTKNELREFTLKYLSNSNYTNTLNDDAINSYIEREVKQDKKIEKALYTYNYFRRFYDLDIDGMKLYDFVMFNMQGFDSVLTPNKISELYLSDSTGSSFNTNETNTKYNNILSSYTKLKNLSNFLEYVVTHFSDEDMDKWTANQFKGILFEIPVEENKNIQYTLWDHFSHEDDEHKDTKYVVYNYILPILTLPETASYIISAPAQFTIGSQRVYMENPTDSVELANFKAKMKVYTDRIASYYNTAYSILQDENLFNDIHLYQIDKRSTKDENGVVVYNIPYTTEELFHKNFNEVVGLWPADYGVNAGNWGDRIEWNVAGFMDSDIKNDGNIDNGHPTWATWSHETAHYLDDRLFLKDNDRRYDSGGEDYADEFLMQKFGSGIVMNLSINFKEKTEVATNLTPIRINSKTKIHDFYRKMFEAIYAVDYIEAKAFLKLTKEEQKTLGVQISYPNENKKFATIDGKSHNFNLDPDLFKGETYANDKYAKFRARRMTQYTPLSNVKEDIDLKTIDDLIDNRIMLYTNLTKTTTREDNSYGGEGIDIVHWYQPNNPDGRPDSYSLKWLSYEMLGYKGYDEGFVEYASNIHYESRKTYTSLLTPTDEFDNPILSDVKFKSDDMAISKISLGQYTTIDQYKKARFNQTGEKLKHLRFIDVDYYAQKMYDALVDDAKKQDRSYTNSIKIRKEIYYLLKNSTNDFEEEIYSNDRNQTIKFDIKTQKEKD